MAFYVKVNEIIDAEHYNVLQNRVANVLGTGTLLYGYGQTLTSSIVQPNTIIYASHMQNLKSDINKARLHQVNNQNFTVPTFNNQGVQSGTETYTLDDSLVGDLIRAGEVDDNDNAAVDDTTKSFNDFDRAVGIIETDHLVANINQMVTNNNVLADTSTSSWNGSISHLFRATFTSGEHRRFFFNTGGTIFITSANLGPTAAKGNDWKNLLDNIGILSFNYNSTTKSGTSGTVYAVGNSNLTNSFTLIASKGGSAPYAENIYSVQARVVPQGVETVAEAKIIEFYVRYEDIDSGDQTGEGPAVDEDVDGTIENIIGVRYAQGSSTVNVDPPTFATVTGQGLP